MKLSCPACGATASLDVLLGHEGAREAVMAAMVLPAPLGKVLVQYIALFRPASRNLSMDRLASLFTELQPMIAAARIERNGRSHSAPLEYWQMAMGEMLAKRDKLTLPLKNHGYLFSIIEGYSLKAEAKTEAQTEARRGGQTPPGASAAAAPHPLLKAEVKPRTAMPDHVKSVLRKDRNDST